MMYTAGGRRRQYGTRARNPMPLPEIQPRMFPAQHQQYVGDEYPRTPALCSASPTTGRCQDPRFSLPNALHRIQFEIAKNIFIIT